MTSRSGPDRNPQLGERTMLQHGGPDGQAGKRVVLYGRVSTPVQKVESQMGPLRTYAASRGLQVVEEITDIGISGKKASRPGLNRLMDMARKRLIDGVIVFQFSRFARSIRHLLEALQEFKSLGISFISYSENIDTNTPLGEALFAVIGALSQLEADLIRERVVAGLARVKAEGKRLGRPRVEVTAEKVAGEYARLKSIRLVARQLKISPATVQRLLRRCS
jgi:DNA invertase Pin-like site-specific DNA recombinase